eukprot:TRINITY_DN1985_c0_g1_i1.p1 TRINITY_DN1985_c0_g1~~TRINITY_DN1985_c0_g1_i1.p1  ORF type:complete len:588 (-),score=104.43 TRINITY_DN1985_c0_g1_i1:23-1786(-)
MCIRDRYQRRVHGECITIISAAIGYDNFKEYSTSLIELFISIQDGELNKGDPQRFYLLGAWQRICLLMQKEFVPYLPKIIPNLLKIVSTVPGMSLSKSGLASGSLESIIREVCGEKSNQLELSTSETEEIEMGLQMLQVFATELREHFAPYVEETSKIVEPMLTFMSNPDLRKQSAKLLAPLLKSLSTAGCSRDSVVNIGSKFIALLLNSHQKEVHTDVRSAQVLGLKYVIDEIGHFMNAKDTEIMIGKVLEFFNKTDERKKALKKQGEIAKEDEDEKDDDLELGDEYEDTVEFEEDYQKDLTYLLGSIMNTHKEEFKPHVHPIIINLIQPYLSGNSNMQKAALFILDDLAEYLGVEKLGEEVWRQIVPIILNYTTKQEPDLRQAACYGVGCLAKSGGTVFKEFAGQCLESLGKAIEIKIHSKTLEEGLEAKDNAIASIGKILKYQPTSVSFPEIWSKWLLLLPIKEDKDEAKDTHKFVVDTLIQYPEAAIGADGKLLGEIIRILVQVFETKLVSKETRHDIVKAIKQLSAHPTIATMLDDLYKTKLKAQEQKVLETIMKSQLLGVCLLYTSPSPRDLSTSRMPSSA